MERHIEFREQLSVPVPETLRNPHPFVEATRRVYSDVQPDEDGRMRPGPREGIAHLIVSRKAACVVHSVISKRSSSKRNGAAGRSRLRVVTSRQESRSSFADTPTR